MLGAGDDTFGWAPSDGSDVLFGQSGVDRLIFDGDASAETFRVSRAGSETLLERHVGGVTMRLTGVERIELLDGAGEDRIDIADLSGSDVTDSELELGAFRGATAGDDERDDVTVDLGKGIDQVSIFGSGGRAVISGLPAVITLLNADASYELVIRGGRGPIRSRRLVSSEGHASSSTAARAMISSSAAMGTTSWSGVLATTSPSAARATTRRGSAPEPTCSSGPTATAATPSTAAAALTS